MLVGPFLVQNNILGRISVGGIQAGPCRRGELRVLHTDDNAGGRVPGIGKSLSAPMP
jgi:hypothetical protein